VVARIDQMPGCQTCLDQLTAQIDAAKKNAPPMKQGPGRFRFPLERFSAARQKSCVMPRRFRLDLDVSGRTKELTVNFNVVANPAVTCKAIKDRRRAQESARQHGQGNRRPSTAAIHLAKPTALNKALGSVIDEAKVNGLKAFREQKRAQAKLIFDAMDADRQSGESTRLSPWLVPAAQRYTFIARSSSRTATARQTATTPQGSHRNIPADQPQQIQARLRQRLAPSKSIVRSARRKIAPSSPTSPATSALHPFALDACSSPSEESLATLNRAGKEDSGPPPLVFDSTWRAWLADGATPEQKDSPPRCSPAARMPVRLAIEGAPV